MGCQVHAIGKAIRPLFADPVTYLFSSSLARPLRSAAAGILWPFPQPHDRRKYSTTVMTWQH